MSYLTRKGWNISESWHPKNTNLSTWLGVAWSDRAMWGNQHISCLSCVCFRDRSITLCWCIHENKHAGGKKKKEPLKIQVLFCCIQYALVSYLKKSIWSKIYSTCVDFYVLKLEVLNIPYCKNKSRIFRADTISLYSLQFDATLIYQACILWILHWKPFSQKWAWWTDETYKKDQTMNKGCYLHISPTSVIAFFTTV